MKGTKEQVEEAILHFADRYGLKNNYQALMNNDYGTATLPEVVKMISYQMFLNQFSPFQLAEKNYQKYELIHQYALELNEKGRVDFE